MTEPKPDLEQLLRTGVAAARAGNRGAAHALFCALTRSYPGDLRAWLGLAGVAASAQEQREALERVLAIEPEHPKARAALARLAPAVAPAAPAPTPTPAPPAMLAESPAVVSESSQDEPAIAHRRFPLLNMIAIGMITLLIIAIAALLGGLVPVAQPAAVTPAALPSPVLQTAAPSLAAADPSAAPLVTPPASLATAAAAAPTPAVSATAPAASLPAPASLPLGTLVDVDGWSATLIRPEYALALDGSIGDLQPAGRFVLALIAISNNSDSPRHIPADLFAIVDNQGRRYSPAPNASSAYLAIYERGQHGDLALEDSLAPRSGMRSVPILFDVPLNATGLVLTVQGSGAAGWPIEGAPAPANVGP